MNRKGLLKALVACFTIVLFSTVCWADALDSIVGQTQSTDPAIRRTAFTALLPYLTRNPIDPRASSAVTDLLVLETNEVGTDDDGDYFSGLIAAVVNLNDPLTIPALVGVIESGNMVPRRLAQYGTAALGAVIARATDENWIVRKCVMITLTDMLTPPNSLLVSDRQSMAEINAALSQGVLDTSPYVSESALPGLQLLPSTSNPADVNGDGVVNCVDLHLVRASFGRKISQSGFDPRADINKDGLVNILDLSAVAREIPAGTVCQ